MGMFHPTSGKLGYDYYWYPTQYQISKEKLIDILKREDELRASEQYQNKYSEQDRLFWFMNVTDEIQTQALRENGVAEENMNDALVVLRNARWEYRNDPEVNRLTIYMREDNSRAGNLKEGDPIPNVPLMTRKFKPTTLESYCMKKQTVLGKIRPIVVCAGSVS